MTSPDPPSGRPRGRPALTEAEASEMRRHIADCAMRLFQEDGYEAVSMRRLASEAGCTVMTLYRYFDRKIDILRALWAEILGDLFDRLGAIAEDESHALKRLEKVSFGYVDFWLQRREHYFLVFMSSGVSQSDVSVFVAEDGVVERFGVLHQSLAAALESNASDAEIELKTQSLLCALNGIAHNLITISAYPWADPKTLVDAAVSGVLLQ